MALLQGKLLTGKLHRRGKGYSLVELIAAMGIFLIVTASVSRLFVYTSVVFKGSIRETREDFYVNEAFRYIDTAINNGVKRMDVTNDVIVLERLSYIRPEKKPVDYIRREGDNVVIKYYEYGVAKTTNIILRNIEEFKVKKEGNLLYISIKPRGGKGIERCLGSDSFIR
jgi:hypothetical protein